MSTTSTTAIPVAAPAPAPAVEHHCSICWQIVPDTKLRQPADVHDAPSATCTNPIACCDTCWASITRGALNEWQVPKCPRCSQALAKRFLLSIAGIDAKLLDRMDLVSLRKYLLLEPNVFHCPRPSCPMSWILEPEKRVAAWNIILEGTARPVPLCSTMRCPACSQEVCLTCKEPAHTGASVCLGKVEDRALVMWRSRNTKPCPGCKLPVEKNGGCNHMHCSHCDLPFCWDCMVPLQGHDTCNPPDRAAVPPPRPAVSARGHHPPTGHRGDRDAPRDRRDDRPHYARRHPRATLAAAAPATPPVVDKKKERKERKAALKAANAPAATIAFDPRSLRRSILV